ncbi:MAG: UvrD-helicase domain-containing protein [Syntrophales bacterium]|nr:UvrD-helicase domain-containing protein [Syntrophales bacterium]MDY0044493.1 UvrD-helicase domain-containing protein [Syntrophales bacterium]
MVNDLPDSSARSAALDTSRSHHVESPAGAGKTLLLTTRFVKLLTLVKHPSDILALTFTEKAAQEMKGRVIDSMKRARKGEQPKNPADGIMLGYAKEALERQKEYSDTLLSSSGLNIMTFHGFCRHLSSRAPLEAGINPEFEIIDETDTPLFIRESVEKTIERLLKEPNTDMRRFALEQRALYHDNNWESFTQELVELVENRNRFADLIDAVHSAAGTDASQFTKILEKRFRLFVERTLATLKRNHESSSLGKNWSEFVLHLREMGAEAAAVLPSSIPCSQWENLPEWQRIGNCLLTNEGNLRKQMGPKTGFYSGFLKSSWAELLKTMPVETIHLLHEIRDFPLTTEPIADMNVLFELIIVASEIIADYERACRNANVLDFNGLEQCALRVLDTADPSDLQLFLDRKIEHILIDEFQDTNRIQWELLRRLVSGWESKEGKTVFIVGDPKQSIYAFRNAEVSLFFEAKRGIPRDGSISFPLLSHRLETNFRSCASLIYWINGLFDRTVMSNPDSNADEVPYSPSWAFDKETTSGSVTLNLFACEDRKKAEDAEALWLAGIIKEKLKETEGRLSIAILLFTRSRITKYLKAFNEMSLSVAVQEGLRLLDRPEANYLFQAAKLLTNPHDDLAWASLIRSPWSWYGLPVLCEAALLEPSSWNDKLRIMSHRHGGIKTLLEKIDYGFARTGRDPLGTVVKRLWEALEGPRVTASLYGMRGVANCLRLCRILDEMDSGIPQETLKQLESVAEKIYEPADPSAYRSPVSMMTVHHAKGLEFDIVYIPFMDWKPLFNHARTSPPYLLERIPGTGGEHLIATGKDRREETALPLFRLLAKLEKEKKWGEAKRWFYVAATRAKKELHLSGIAVVKDEKVFAPPRSPLSWVMKHENLEGTPASKAAGYGSNGPAVFINPEPPLPEGMPAGPQTLPEPFEIYPEKPPYSVLTPSSSQSQVPCCDIPPKGAQTGEGGAERIRGIIIHRLLKFSLERKALPSTVSITRSLVREGLDAETAAELSADIKNEVAATLSHPFLRDLTGAHNSIIKCEWGLEDRITSGRIRSGRIDLACFDGNAWWLIDFKTSRPGSGIERANFIHEQRQRYRSQIEHYKSMASKLELLAKNEIHAGIFFTAPGVWIEI